MKRVILILPIFLAACSILSDSDTKVTSENFDLRTDSTVYTSYLKQDGSRPEYGFNLVAKVENRSKKTIYLDRCSPDSTHPTYKMELIDQTNTWGSAYSGVGACVGHDNPITVPAGSVRIDTLHLNAPNVWLHGTNEWLGVLEGKFRLVYRAQTCRSVGKEDCTLPDILSKSNEFEVRLAK